MTENDKSMMHKWNKIMGNKKKTTHNVESFAQLCPDCGDKDCHCSFSDSTNSPTSGTHINIPVDDHYGLPSSTPTK